MKSLSRSDIISRGRPFSQNHLRKNSLARPCTVSVHEVGMIQMSELRRSVIVSIQSCPLLVGRGPIKSIATESHH